MKNTVDEFKIDEIAIIIKNGGVVIIPFDTVYGYACSPFDQNAIEKIFELKKRPSTKTLGLAVAEISTIDKIADLSARQKKYIQEKTPGKYTLILRAKKDANLPQNCLQNGTVAVRIPASSLVLEVIKKSGGIIAQTSANISGKNNCYSIEELEDQYGNEKLKKIDLIVDGGKIDSSGASTIIDLTKDKPEVIERK